MIQNRLEQRHLNWEACYNTRDLGGLLTTNGETTRWGAVIRSDILDRLTPNGRQALLDYGVRTIIDLRGVDEVAEGPSPFAHPSGSPAAPHYRNLPLEKYYPHVSELIGKAQSRGAVYCITLDHYPDCVAAVIRAIANAQPGGIVIHCHAGKDRTGIVAGLLLKLAGVADEIIAADYAESQARLWPLYEQKTVEAGGEEKVDFWLKPTALPEMMQMMLDHLAAKYGGVHLYLQQAGLTEVELNAVAARLIG